ncbi:16S rRNA (guanine(527)-N(7))-methyltransferase RsmG [Campylobacter peloridis]|uniref:Ribosomal RNA small subunit methyltransferase G n=1 Tax=Campylobacter peloridis TaxID=488546 RepID=A0ABX6TSQ2_9BACT|nr:16S rRNA (guanine(527)-N(7))-methyltransferase RsmG [Campylobacter peloridis]AJC85048.1 16S rRNA m7G527 methyltransferase [Campylobacter peloridis LMG 23910]QOQ89080.1 16S rRNA (guanine(527)-N(7))-methyltransferase RsmG [Campylobacter peloridis]
MNLYYEKLNFIQNTPNDDFFKKIQIYKNLLNKFNAIHNLTHLANIDENIIDSLKILDFCNINHAKKIIDIGSGAGFPAVFLACILQESEFFLFEPNAKKAAFLRVIKTELGLDKITIIKEKIQTYPKFKVDIITSRALMDVKPLIKIAKGFYDEKTLFLLYKGSEIYKEIQGLSEYKIYNQGYRNYCLINVKE